MTNVSMEMLSYHTWANQTILGRIKELPSSVLSQELNSSFPTIAHALSHIYAVDQMWYLVLSGMVMGEALQECMPLNGKTFLTVEEYMDTYAALADRYQQWIQSQTDLEQTIILDNPYAGICETTLSNMLLHVVNHGTYHRGNVSTMLRQLGHASVMNDYCLFWYQQPVQFN